MGRIVVTNFVSLDGVVQAPLSAEEDRDDGFDQGGWVPPFADESLNAFMAEATVNAAGLLLGRRSYEIMREAWSGADESEPAVAAMNRMPKFVVTSSEIPLDWEPSHRLRGDLTASIARLKTEVEGDIAVFGAATLTRGLAERDLVDEYRLLIFPIVLGAGKRMFGENSIPARFTLAGSTVTPTGVAVLTYARES